MSQSFIKFSAEEQAKLAAAVVGDSVVKLLASLKQEAAAGDRFEVVFTSGMEDRHGERVNPDGWDFTNYMKNPVVLYAHDYSSLPIGMTEEIVRDGERWIARGVFAPEEMNPLAGQVAKLYKAGFLKTVSVGFMPLEMDANMNSTKQELLEISFVPVPANPEALALAKTLGFDPSALVDSGIFVEQKEAIPPHDTPMMDEDAEWDADAARKRVEDWATEDGTLDMAKYEQAFAYVDREHADTIGAYKLPHHDIRDGELVVVWRGVAAAMAALMGGRGGVDIPEGDREAVMVHLARHYEQYGKPVPEKAEGGAEGKAAGPAHEKIGRVLSEANRTLIRDVSDGMRTAIRSMEKVLTALEDLLQSTEPPQGQNVSPQGVAKDVNLVHVQRLVRIADKSIEDALRHIGRNLKA